MRRATCRFRGPQKRRSPRGAACGNAKAISLQNRAGAVQPAKGQRTSMRCRGDPIVSRNFRVDPFFLCHSFIINELVDQIRVQRFPMKRDSVSLLFRLKRDVFRDLG